MVMLLMITACAVESRDGETGLGGTPSTSSSGTSADAPATGADTGHEAGTTAHHDSSSDDGGDTLDPDTTTGGGPSDPWPSVDCAADNDAIWVLTRDHDAGGATQLHRFAPESVTLSWAADLECLDGYGQGEALSLAVDRAGMGYVSGATDDALLRLPLLGEDPCAQLIEVPWGGPSPRASLAFRSDDVLDPGHERLFAFMPLDHGGGYAEIFHHLEDLPLALLATTSVTTSHLSGAGDGQLVGAGFDDRLRRVDPSLGAEFEVPGAPELAGRAIAMYDGSVFLFGSPGASGIDGEQEQEPLPPAIERFSLDGSQQLELVITYDALTSLDVLTVAVSTCAPTTFG